MYQKELDSPMGFSNKWPNLTKPIQNLFLRINIFYQVAWNIQINEQRVEKAKRYYKYVNVEKVIKFLVGPKRPILPIVEKFWAWLRKAALQDQDHHF